MNDPIGQMRNVASLNLDDIEKLGDLISDASPCSTPKGCDIYQNHSKWKGEASPCSTSKGCDIYQNHSKWKDDASSLPKGVISEEVTFVESTRKKYYDKLVITTIKKNFFTKNLSQINLSHPLKKFASQIQMITALLFYRTSVEIKEINRRK